MASHGQWSKGTEMATVSDGNKSKGDYDEKYGLFVDVPAKQEGGVAAESDSANEVLPAWAQKELDEWKNLEEQSQDETNPRANFWQYSKR
jgi:hypothetical protein